MAWYMELLRKHNKYSLFNDPIWEKKLNKFIVYLMDSIKFNGGAVQ